MGYIIAHDVGTSCNKATLVDERGHVVDSAVEPYEIYYPKEGYAEQDPEDWWKAVAKSTKLLLEKTGIPRDQVLAVTFSTQMLGIIPIAERGVLRRAIIWLDSRASAQAKKIMGKFLGEKVFAALAGAPLTGKDGLPKLLWLKENEKEIYEKMETFLDTSGYLIYRATGKIAMELSCASGFGIDLKKNDWLRGIFRYSGIDDKKLPPLVSSTELVGRLTDEAAKELGLLSGTPIYPGSTDVASASVGAGCVNDRDVHLYLGTSGWVVVVISKPPTGKKGVVCIKSADRNKALLFAETETAGYCLKWIKDEFYRKESSDPNIKNVFALMDEDVENVEPGSGHLIFTPWMYGERAPINNYLARSVFFNISAAHKREHLLRAVYEGVGYNLRWIFEIIEKDFGISFPSLRVIGGGARGDIWMQIISDISGKKLETLENPQERGAIGAAFCAMIGMGLYREFEEIKNLIAPKRIFIPNPENRKIYDFMYENYKYLYKYSKNLYRNLNL